MDEKNVAQLRKFVSTITDPKISAFIDLKKLCQSGIYSLAVQMATEHAVKHNDFGYLEKILNLLDGSNHMSGFIASLRPKIHFVVTDTKPRRFKKATPEKAARQAAEKLVVKPTPPKPAPMKVVKVKEKISEDLMDSRFMMPGSYGSGKRR